MKIKTIIMSLFLMLSVVATSAMAKDIELALYYKPGGGSDRHSSILAKALETQGITVNKKFFKTCVEAMNHVKNNKNAYLFGIATDLRPEASGKCPGLNSYNTINLYTTVGDMPTMFCTTPTKGHITMDTLRTSDKPILVGNPTGDANWIPFNMFLENAKEKLNIKVIPYSGAGDTRRAAYADNVDMVFVAGGSSQLVAKGASCLAASTKANWADAPFLGDFTTMKNFPETGLQTAIYSNGNGVPAEIDNAMKRALSSDQFKNDMDDNKLGHSGLGAGKSTEAQAAELKEIFKLYDSKAKK
jgi:tripartite-type tricarboxylate transporter receptor subunit TctC